MLHLRDTPLTPPSHPLQIPTLHHFTAHYVGDHIYIFGGVDEEGSISSNIYRLHLFTKTWSVIEPPSTVIQVTHPHETSPNAAISHTIARQAHSGIYDPKHRILLYFGGLGKGGVPRNDMLVYHLDHAVWTLVTQPPGAPTPRYGHSAALVGQSMYLFGGRNFSGTVLDDFFVYDMHQHVWDAPKLLPPLPPASYDSTFSVWKGNLLLYTPESGEIWAYRIAEGQWKCWTTHVPPGSVWGGMMEETGIVYGHTPTTPTDPMRWWSLDFSTQTHHWVDVDASTSSALSSPTFYPMGPVHGVLVWFQTCADTLWYMVPPNGIDTLRGDQDGLRLHALPKDAWEAAFCARSTRPLDWLSLLRSYGKWYYQISRPSDEQVWYAGSKEGLHQRDMVALMRSFQQYLVSPRRKEQTSSPHDLVWLMRAAQALVSSPDPSFLIQERRGPVEKVVSTPFSTAKEEKRGVTCVYDARGGVRACTLRALMEDVLRTDGQGASGLLDVFLFAYPLAYDMEHIRREASRSFERTWQARYPEDFGEASVQEIVPEADLVVVVPKNVFGDMELEDVEAEELARQWTMYTYKALRAIPRQELMRWSVRSDKEENWTMRSRGTQAWYHTEAHAFPHIAKVQRNFDALIGWVRCMLLRKEKGKRGKRSSKMAEKIILTAHALLELGNLQDALAIAIACTMGGVVDTFLSLHRDAQSKLSEVLKLLDEKDNWVGLKRLEYQHAIPPLELVLHDVARIHDAMPDCMGDLIHMGKWKKLYQRLSWWAKLPEPEGGRGAKWQRDGGGRVGLVVIQWVDVWEKWVEKGGWTTFVQGDGGAPWGHLVNLIKKVQEVN